MTDNTLGATNSFQFAFKEGHQCHEVVFILRRLTEISLEWAVPIFILDGDIVKAYDYTDHVRILEALTRNNIKDFLAAAILREVARPKGILRLGDKEGDSELHRSRALWQGDPLAPKLFNATLDILSQDFDKEAKRKKWGYPIQRHGKIFNICLLCFADNYWIIATSPKELQEANDHWQGLLLSAGWHTPAEDMRYASTAEDHEHKTDITFKGKVVERVSRHVGFKALGTQITFVTRHDVEFQRRIKAAWAAFFKNTDILCCKVAPVRKCLDFLHLVVTPALFWCSGSWNLRVDQYIKLRGLQRKMIRKMMRFKKEEAEDLDHFMRRTERSISNIIECHNVLSWDVLARRNIFKWAGWTARLFKYDPNRITLSVLEHKNLKWIMNIASQNRGRQLHGKYLHTWRWESLVYKYFEENYPGTDWCEVAQSADDWHEIVKNVF